MIRSLAFRSWSNLVQLRLSLLLKSSQKDKMEINVIYTWWKCRIFFVVGKKWVNMSLRPNSENISWRCTWKSIWMDLFEPLFSVVFQFFRIRGKLFLSQNFESQFLLNKFCIHERLSQSVDFPNRQYKKKHKIYLFPIPINNWNTTRIYDTHMNVKIIKKKECLFIGLPHTLF